MQTYGEAMVEKSRSMRMKKGTWVQDRLAHHKNKMSRDKAEEYYKGKLKRIWEKLGMTK